MAISRRHFMLRSSLAAVGTTALPALAHVASAAPPVGAALMPVRQWQLIESVAEAIVPGAAQAGIRQFLQKQLAQPSHQVLLMVRYLALPLTPVEFYRQLGAQLQQQADLLSHEREEFTRSRALTLADAMAEDAVDNWQGLPASLFHFVLRSDGCDVVYGTPAGSRLLGVEYMPHIRPAEVL